MGESANWIHRRRGTFTVSFFIVGWYLIQLGVFEQFGGDIARWWFYFPKPPGGISPGVILAPISHDMVTLTHIGSNLLLLLVAGGLIEPYIGRKRLLVLALSMSYLSVYLANATVFFHQFWIFAGASGGVLALWAYTGMKLQRLARKSISDGLTLSRRGIESLTAFVVLVTTPFIFLRELLVAVPPHSGHLFGLILGSMYFALESYDS